MIPVPRIFARGLRLALVALLACAPGCATAEVRPTTEPPLPRTEPCAEARPSEEAALQAARADFEEALARQTAGDWAGALLLLQRVAAVRATPHVWFNVALSEEFVGKLNAARGRYERAALEAQETGAEDVRSEAIKRRDALVTRIPTVLVVIGSAPPGTSFTLNGVEIGAAALDRPLPVDPGTHAIEASAPEHKPFRAVVTVDEGQRKTVLPLLTKR